MKSRISRWKFWSDCSAFLIKKRNSKGFLLSKTFFSGTFIGIKSLALDKAASVSCVWISYSCYFGGNSLWSLSCLFLFFTTYYFKFCWRYPNDSLFSPLRIFDPSLVTNWNSSSSDRFILCFISYVRNTYTGLSDIPNPLRESAVVLGLPLLPPGFCWNSSCLTNCFCDKFACISWKYVNT